MRRLAMALVALVLLGACQWDGPLVPVVPPTPPVVPPEPGPGPDPTPIPVPAGVVPYEATQRVVPGLTVAEVTSIAAMAPALDTRQDDGTRILRWPSVSASGAARWLDVHFDAAGRVMGRSLVPRVQ